MPRDLITIQIDDKRVLQALERIRLAGIRPQPMLQEIGEDLLASTKERFLTSKAPDGTQWAKNSPVTISRFFRSRSGTVNKQGFLSAKGGRLWDSKKPLIGRSKLLSHTINYQIRASTLLVGSDRIYAGPQQFGAKKGEFGSTKRGSPIPWGDIPARPFLGLSSTDVANILVIVERYLLNFSRP